MKNCLVNEFRERVVSKNEFQKKYLSVLDITSLEWGELEKVLEFLGKTLGQPVEYLADAYLFVNQMVLEEQYFFIRNGRYRNTTFEEVNCQVYQNQDYMTKYMTGLTIADYIWSHHLRLIRYFVEKLSVLATEGESYLEIGPGFGQYLIRAVNSHRWKNYLAIDISSVSVQNCKRFLSFSGIELGSEVCIREQDFLSFSVQKDFDCIVCGEVLEHVEEPLYMLEKMYSLLSSKGRIFITTVMNSPTVDHIYLFSARQEVIELVEKAGFIVEDYICTTVKNLTVEKAEKNRMPIYIALVLRKS